MLQKYCACHEKVEPRHTKSCNCHAKWSLQSNISVTWNLQSFHGFSVGGFKHRHHKARNHCPCHAKCIVSEPLQSPHAYQRFWNSCVCHTFWNVSKSLRLPREKHFKPQKVVRDLGVLTILTSKSLSRAGVVQILPTSTSKSAPTMPVFNDFDFQIVLARRRGANFADFNFQKCSDHAIFLRFWLPNRSGAQAWCKFWRLQLPKVLRTCQFLTILTSKSCWRAGVVQILSHLGPQILRTRSFLGPDFSSRRSHKTMEKHSISRTSYPPNPDVTHLCCITSARSHPLVDRFSATTFSIVGS